ncbi:hypothetical protein ANO11243_049770 [Dothideomycetidae sp. 11243]|nr:hypothetical protein ANO11243_049770 [fungal sp. No.11243]
MTATNGHTSVDVPLLINGRTVSSSDTKRQFKSSIGDVCQGASVADCEEAVSGASSAFAQWSTTSVPERRRLLGELSALLRERGPQFRSVIEREIRCDAVWSNINLQETIKMIDETAALLTSEALQGRMLPNRDPDAHALVFQEPLGVVLGIAPWNAPLILGMRSVLAPVAVGNTAIFKGSELSPKVHYMIAELFRDAQFPPGVVNFIIHRAQDAVEVFDSLINAPAIRKCNFTGSTAVGRIVAEKAGAALKPVLLELGGKNCSIVLKDADIERAAAGVADGATMNNGQICMSTDIVIVAKEIVAEFSTALKRVAAAKHGAALSVINSKSSGRLQSLVKDAKDHGADVWTQSTGSDNGDELEAHTTVVFGLTPKMKFWGEESFGPMMGVVEVADAQEAIDIVNASGYGLSCSIWTRDHLNAIAVSRKLRTGAVHVNASTVHDESTLPHGGDGLSGFGRFNSVWGLREFVQTKTVILNP